MQDAFGMARRGDLRSLVPALEARPSLLKMRDGADNTLLHVACEGQHVEMVEFLLFQGSSTKRLNDALLPPVHLAVSRHSEAESALLLVRILCQAGAEVFAPAGKAGETLLHRAGRFGHPRLVHFLVKELRSRHAQPSLATLGGGIGVGGTTATSRSEADRSSSADNRTFSRSPSPIDDCDRSRTTALQRTASRRRLRRRGRLQLPQYTVQQFLNTRNIRGEAALHLAAGTSHLAVVSALLSLDADLTLRDCRHRTPYEMTEHWTHGGPSAEIRRKLRPPRADASMPVLVFTPVDASPPVNCLLSPQRSSGGRGSGRKGRGRSGSPGGGGGGGGRESSTSVPRSFRRTRADGGGTLSPVIDLQLEFAREEAAALRARTAARDAAVLQRRQRRHRRRGGGGARRGGGAGAGGGGGGGGHDEDDAEETEESDDGSGVGEEAAEADGALAPYHRVLHLLDGGSLELRTAMESTREMLRETADDLQGLGYCPADQPQSVGGEGDRPSLLASRNCQRIRRRLAKLELASELGVHAGGTEGDDTAALVYVFYLGLCGVAIYLFRQLWASYEMWCQPPIFL